MSDSELYIGIMTGTSMDGIDIVLVNFQSNDIQLLHTLNYPLPESLSTQITSLIKGPNIPIKTVGYIHAQLGKIFADGVNALLSQAHISASDIMAVGSHGQTVWHEIDEHQRTRFSMQLGDANWIAEHTGITTVADFRNRDIAAGGQGAPLAPAFHQAVLSSDTENRIVLNIGGIANITLLSPRHGVIGFDTGPGNTLLDVWIKHHQQIPYDNKGTWAQSGTINQALLDQLLRDTYFQQPFPKSTGKEYFNSDWLAPHLENTSIKSADVQATLLELTAKTIHDACNRTLAVINKNIIDRLIVCGGGVHNQFLMERLRYYFSSTTVESSQLHGIHPDWMEAIAFAWLARQTLHRKTSNLPSVTGARHPSILGAIYPAE